eukprot:3080109-Rhodomonas_salina.2
MITSGVEISLIASLRGLRGSARSAACTCDPEVAGLRSGCAYCEKAALIILNKCKIIEMLIHLCWLSSLQQQDIVTHDWPIFATNPLCNVRS